MLPYPLPFLLPADLMLKLQPSLQTSCLLLAVSAAVLAMQYAASSVH